VSQTTPALSSAGSGSVLDAGRFFGYKSGMAEWTQEQMRAQWLLAGRLTGGLSIVQMLIFAVLLVRTSLQYASVNFWLLILGFSISGVVAAVCLSRSRTIPVKYKP
jgi:hypothetical protein